MKIEIVDFYELLHGKTGLKTKQFMCRTAYTGLLDRSSLFKILTKICK